jgi:hypothetical protein
MRYERNFIDNLVDLLLSLFYTLGNSSMAYPLIWEDELDWSPVY